MMISHIPTSHKQSSTLCVFSSEVILEVSSSYMDMKIKIHEKKLHQSRSKCGQAPSLSKS